MTGKGKDIKRVLDDLEFESEVERAFAKAFDGETPDRFVIDEFETRPDTVKELRRACKHCGQPIRILTYGVLEKHEGPCGRPCLGGGVSVGVRFHDDRCVLCVDGGGIEALQRGAKVVVD